MLAFVGGGVVDFGAAPFAAVELAGALLCILTGRLAWRQCAHPGASAMAAASWAAAWWTAWHACSLLAANLPLKLGLIDLWYPGACAVIVSLLVFAIEYRGQIRLGRLRIGLLGVPAMLTALAVWTNPFLHLYWASAALVPGPPFTRIALTFGPGNWLFVAWESLCFLTITILLLTVFFEYRGLYARQTATMLIGLGLPWTTYALFVTGHPFIPGYDLTAIGIAFGLPLLGWSVYGRPFDVAPVAHHVVMDRLADAVLVEDNLGRVVYLNSAAAELAGASNVIGRRLDQVIADLAALADSDEPDRTLTRGIGSDQRIYDVRISPLHSGAGESLGRAFILRDDTERRRAEELQYSRQQVIAAEEGVRQRLAEFLHGPVQTKLLTSWVRLGEYEKRRAELSNPEADAMLSGIRDDLNRIREEDILRVSQLLYPPGLRLGLLPAIEYLAGGFDNCFEVEIDAGREWRALDSVGENGLSPDLRLVAYRFVEEALNNAAKHAHASQVDVRLKVANEACAIEVRDDGRGFEPERARAGFGFHGITGRVEQVGGAWDVHSQPGQGTTMSLVLPLAARP